MPKYRVRIYYTYMDEFEVEAADEDEAEEMADAYADTDTEHITRIRADKFVGYDKTLINELDTNGHWIEED